MKNPKTGENTTSDNLKVHPRMKELYKFFKLNGKVIDIENYDPTIASIYSREILRMITNGEEGWEDMVPDGIAELIKSRNLLGFKAEEKLLEVKK